MLNPKPSRVTAVLSWCWLLALAGTIALLAWHSLSDRDVWLHLRAGRDILADGRVPTTNTYSFTAPDAPWVDHEWAFQVVIAVLGPSGEDGIARADVGGWHGLRVALALLLALVLLVGDERTIRARGGRTPGALLGAGLGLLLGTGLLWTRLILRPELVSYVLLAVLLRQIEAALAEGPRAAAAWRTWLDPRRPGGRALLATVVWAQFHGFAGAAPVLWLLGVAAAVLGPRLRTDSPGAIGGVRVGLVGAALAGVALAATPNGLAGLTYPLRAIGQFGGEGPALEGMISELVPLLETTNALGTTLVLFRISLVWGILWIAAQWGRIPLLRILVWLVTVWLALAGQRGLGPYAVAFMLLHTVPASAPRVPWLGRRAAGGRYALAAAVGSAVAMVCLAGLVWPRLIDDRFYLGEGVARRFGPGLTPAHAATGAAAWLAAHGANRVVANVDAAGCLLAGTPARLWIDGRTEAYPSAAWRQYDLLRRGGPDALALLSRDRPDAVCLTLGSTFAPLIRDLLQAPAWRLAHAGDAALVFVPEADPAAGMTPAARAADLLRRAERPGSGTARRADLCQAAALLREVAGDADGALAALRRGVELRPDHPLLRHNLGTAFLARQRFAAARTEFHAALSANPRLADAASNAGVCELQLGDLAAAEVSFRRALAIDRRHFQAWANLAGLLARRGDAAGALEAVTRALEIRPGDPRLRAARDQLRATPPRR